MVGTRTWYIGLVLLVALSGCAASPASEGEEPAGGGSNGVVAVPTWTDFGGEDALLGGVLGGSPDVDGGCVWLENEVGDRQAVLWPPGYHAGFDPVRLFNGDGEVVAREGDRIQAGGGYYRESIPRCGLGNDSVARIRAILTVGSMPQQQNTEQSPSEDGTASP